MSIRSHNTTYDSGWLVSYTAYSAFTKHTKQPERIELALNLRQVNEFLYRWLFLLYDRPKKTAASRNSWQMPVSASIKRIKSDSSAPTVPGNQPCWKWLPVWSRSTLAIAGSISQTAFYHRPETLFCPCYLYIAGLIEQPWQCLATKRDRGYLT